MSADVYRTVRENAESETGWGRGGADFLPTGIGETDNRFITP